MRGASTSFPRCLVAMKLAAQLEARGAQLTLEWAPRELNQEADDLTHGEFGCFDPGLRITKPWEDLPWLVLPQLMAEAQAFYADLAALRKRAGQGGAAAADRRKRPANDPTRLRHREPW